MNRNSQAPNFSVRSEKRELNITKDYQADIGFEVTSQMPVRGEAHLVPISAAGSNAERDKETLSRWLAIVGERELEFEGEGGYRTYTARITVPDDAQPGVYVFRLRVVDVAQPDEAVGESGDITFHVVGPKPSPGWFIVAAVVLFLLLVGAVLGAVVYVQNETTLQVVVEPLQTGVHNVGEPVTFVVSVKNQRRSQVVTGVRLAYTLPEGVVGAYAAVDGGVVKHCDERLGEPERVGAPPPQLILCDLGVLLPQEEEVVWVTAILDPNGVVDDEQMTVTLTPQPTATGEAGVEPTPTAVSGVVVEKTLNHWTIDHTFVVSSNEVKRNGIFKQVTTEVERCVGFSDREQPGCRELFVTLDPAAGEVGLGEVVTQTVRIWNNDQFREVDDVSLRYRLPDGMRYRPAVDRRPFLPQQADCSQPTYLEVVCRLREPLKTAVGRIEPTVVELPLIATGAGLISNTVTISSTGYLSATADLLINNVNTALRFDGIDDWVELDFKDANGLPDAFTVEMWVHPFSTDNGQSFMAAHTEKGENIFQVGYWQEKDGSQDGLLLDIMGDQAVVSAVKRTDRYHLAVAVQKDPRSQNRYDVATYINGQLVDNRVFAGQLRGNHEWLNWVLGQDWDEGSPELKKTDFFKGTLSEVRIWKTVRTAEQIAATMALRPTGQETDLRAYWRLEPVRENDASLSIIAPNLVVAAGNETRDETLQGGAELFGATWGEIDPRFGTALSFDGVNDALRPQARVGGATSGQLALDLHLDQPLAATLATWLKVPGIPTERQWIVGQVGSELVQGIVSAVTEANTQLAALDKAEADERAQIAAQFLAAQETLAAAMDRQRQAQITFNIAQQAADERQSAINAQVAQLDQSLAVIRDTLRRDSQQFFSGLEGIRTNYEVQSANTRQFALAGYLPFAAFFPQETILEPLDRELGIFRGFVAQEERLFALTEQAAGSNSSTALNGVLAQIEAIDDEAMTQANTSTMPGAINHLRNNQWTINAPTMLSLMETMQAFSIQERNRLVGQVNVIANRIRNQRDVVVQREALTSGAVVSSAEAQRLLDEANGDVNAAALLVREAESLNPTDRSVDRAALVAQRAENLAKLAQPPGVLLATGLLVDGDGHVVMMALRGLQQAGVTDALALETTAFVMRSERVLTADKWTHYAGSIALAAGAETPLLRLYRDGKPQAGEVMTQTLGLDVDCPLGVYIGGFTTDCRSMASLFFHGMLDEVRVWDHVLVSGELQSWMNRPNEFAPDMVAYWPFDDSPSRHTNAVCAVDLSCDETAVSADDPTGYHISVRGPIWVDANFDEN